jgi:hypothetical protein
MPCPKLDLEQSMGGVSHLGENDTEAEHRSQRVGVSFTNWWARSELVVLSRAHRGCFCDDCCFALRDAAKTLRRHSLQIWGHACGPDIEKDIFYHEVERYFMINSEVITGKDIPYFE